MRYFLALLVFFIYSSMAYSQNRAESIRLCVSVLENNSRHMVSTTWEQDQLVRAIERLNKSKEVAKGKVARIDPVALESTNEPDSDVRNKGCRFVLYTKLTEVQRADEIAIPRPSAIEVGQIWGDSRAYPRDYNDVTLTYRVTREGRRENWSSGIVGAHDNEDDQTLVSQLLDQVAKRVAKEIREPRPTNPE